MIIFSAVVTKKREERWLLETKQKELAEMVTYLNKKNSDLKSENKAIISDPIEIEREAREKHGYIKQGEIKFKKHKFSISEPEKDLNKEMDLMRSVDAFLFEGPFPWQVPLGVILIAAIFLIVSYRYESKRLHK